MTVGESLEKLAKPIHAIAGSLFDKEKERRGLFSAGGKTKDEMDDVTRFSRELDRITGGGWPPPINPAL